MIFRLTEEQLAQVQADMARKRGLEVAPPPPKPRKFYNVPTVIDGIRFDSKSEAAYYMDVLKLREAAGDIRNLQRQVSFGINVLDRPVQRYRCDYWYYERIPPTVIEWRLVIADFKSPHGAKQDAWKRTQRLFAAAYGQEILEIVG